MNIFQPELDRIRDDVQNGHGKLGLKSTIRLLNLLETMATEIDRIDRRTEFKIR